MGCAQNSWRAAQAGNQDLRTNGFQSDASSGPQAAIPDVADFLKKSHDEHGFNRFLHSSYRHSPDFFRTGNPQPQPPASRSFQCDSQPYAKWTAQQVIEAFPWDTAPKYLLRDRDGIYGTIFRQRLGNMDIKEVITAPQSPWQNPFDINAADLIFASDSPNISTHRISNLTLSRLLLG